MKRIKLLISVLCISLFAVSLTAQAQNTVVKGRLKGLSDGPVKIFYSKEGVLTTDTVMAVGDNFTWKTDLNEPARIGLTAGRNYYYFFAEPGQIELRGVSDSTETYSLTGSPMQKDAEAFAAFTKDLRNELDSLFSEFSKAPEEEKPAIDEKRNANGRRWDKRTEQFIADHPKSSFSLYLVSLEKDYHTIKRLYNKLDESAKRNIVGIKIAQRLKTLEKGLVGTQLEDFTQPDTSGMPVKFSSFKGKYVLIDFWASWCIPCRAENPNVLKAYNAFKDKGFTVVGISLDDKAADWKKAIREDKMPWTQLSDLKGAKNEVSVKFGIQLIPSNFLVDPSGKIVAKDLRGAMLQDKLSELLN